MLTLKTCRAALLKETSKKVRALKDVRAISVNRANDAKFLQTFPGMKTPGGLLVFLGRETTIKGAARDRTCRWNLIVVVKDSKGDGSEKALDIVDTFEDEVLDQQLLNDELTVHGSADVAVAYTDPRFAVYMVSFTTREANER